MAEETPTENPEPEKKGGMKSLLVNLIVGAAAVGSGLGTPYLVSSFSAPVDPNAKKEKLEETGVPAFVEFGEVTVNIDEPRLTRYLRLKISLQVDEADKDEVTKLVELHHMILKDWLNSFLASQQMESIRGATGQNRLRREIQDHFNSALFSDGYERIRGILFEEFNVQ